ncbi:hypothetical protein BDFB_014101, partial [Asbolus verrucosus]
SYDTYPVWYTRQLVKNIHRKNKAHKKFKISGSIFDLIKFKSLRSLVKKQIRTSYSMYLSHIEKDINTNPCNFWNFIRHKKGHTGLPSVMYYDGTELSTSDAIVDGFKEYFSSVYKDLEPTAFVNVWNGISCSQEETSINFIYKIVHNLIDCPY